MNSGKQVRFVNCKFCGTYHKYGKSYCPAVNKICDYCKEESHFEHLCPKKIKDNRNKKQIQFSNCLLCGENHVTSAKSCSAYKKFCCYCGEKNHLEKMCQKNMSKHLNSNMSKSSNSKQSEVSSNEDLRQNKASSRSRSRNRSNIACLFNKQNHPENSCYNNNLDSNETKNIHKNLQTPTETIKFCNFCAKEHSTVKGFCKAFGKRCRYCKKLNHVIEVCGLKMRAQKRNSSVSSNFGSNSNNLSNKMGGKCTSLLNITNDLMRQETSSNVSSNKNTSNVLSNKENNVINVKKTNDAVENSKAKGAIPKIRNVTNKSVKVVAKKDECSSSESENEDTERNKKKAQKYIEVADYYILWQEPKKASKYLIKAKLYSSSEEINEKLEVVTKLMKSSLTAY